MTNTLMIYGAAGYTGRMAVTQAKALGLDTMLAGRDEQVLAKLALESGLPYRVFPLDDAANVNAQLAGVDVLLNCAGPFMRTAEPLMHGAIRAGAHYLDIAAEMDSYRLAEALHEEAVLAGVMLMPGGGGSVAMLGCLAAHAMKRVARPDRVSIALHVSGSMSRGSATSAAQNLTPDCLARVDAVLVPRDPRDIRQFDFGKGMVDCFPVTLPDLVTIWRASGIPNIETFVHVSGTAFSTGDHSALPDGPGTEERDANRYQASVVVTGADGESARSLLDTVNGYSFTPMAAAEAARRMLLGDVRPGFQVPAKHFGAGFAETIADTRIMDVQA
jgi:short subunit dehydrogenase-like uncharacterized protein